MWVRAMRASGFTAASPATTTTTAAVTARGSHPARKRTPARISSMKTRPSHASAA